VAATSLTLSGGSYTDLNASAGTQIDQSGALTVSGTTTLTADGAGVTVLLNGSGNDFNTVSLVDGTGDFGTVSVTDDQNAMTIGGNAATLNAVAATTLTLSGGSYTDLNASAGTQIDQSGALTVSGTTTLTATTGSIVLDDVTN